VQIDNEVIWITFKEHVRYCNNLQNIAQFVHDNQ
jgi:hypothetical protein